MSRFPPDLLDAESLITTVTANTPITAIILGAPGVTRRYRIRLLSVIRLDIIGAATNWHGAIVNNAVTVTFVEVTNSTHGSKGVKPPGGQLCPVNEALRFRWNSNLIGAIGRAKLYYTLEPVS